MHAEHHGAPAAARLGRLTTACSASELSRAPPAANSVALQCSHNLCNSCAVEVIAKR